MKVDNLCFIPAKAASTRLKKKNILKINDRELIYYPIRAAEKSGLFGEHICLSTESEEIREIALKYGAKVPFLREERLAHDPFGVVDVALDFFERVPFYKEFDNIFILLPTAPLISAEDIVNAFNIFGNAKYKYLMSVTETDHNSLQSVFVRDCLIEPVFPEQILRKSQELEKTYRVNGAITIMDIRDFLTTKNYYTYPLGAYVMPKLRSIDIDTEFDYTIAKIIMENTDTL
jgi:CMP-N,N'-diacetyllegionaminic acid synthase